MTIKVSLWKHCYIPVKSTHQITSMCAPLFVAQRANDLTLLVALSVTAKMREAAKAGYVSMQSSYTASVLLTSAHPTTCCISCLPGMFAIG